MKAIKAVYDNGRVSLAEEAPSPGPVEVVVVFPDGEADPWERIESEPTMRPAFAKFMQQCLEDIEKGKAKPLNLEDL
jgi:hypothetical protein